MNNEETIKAGKVSLRRTRGGTVWFLDKNGNKTALNQTPAITKLFETIRDGSGEHVGNVITVATRSNGNLEETNGNRTLNGNGFESYFGGTPLMEH